MSNKDICKKLQELIDVMSDTDMAEYIPAVTAAKDMLTPKVSNKRSGPITGQVTIDDLLPIYS